jgi:hypothetical protein
MKDRGKYQALGMSGQSRGYAFLYMTHDEDARPSLSKVFMYKRSNSAEPDHAFKDSNEDSL